MSVAVNFVQVVGLRSWAVRGALGAEGWGAKV